MKAFSFYLSLFLILFRVMWFDFNLFDSFFLFLNCTSTLKKKKKVITEEIFVVLTHMINGTTVSFA